jgi:hypothetical protein
MVGVMVCVGNIREAPLRDTVCDDDVYFTLQNKHIRSLFFSKFECELTLDGNSVYNVNITSRL